MNRIRAMAKNFVKSDDAIAVTEYGLLVALIAVAIILAVTVLGGKLSNVFDKTSSSLPS